MLSIITVCYNAEKVIEKTIESVLKQKHRDYEYIFIDGESKDGTLEVIKRYSDILKKRGISVRIVSEKDLGIYDAMNKGIAMAKGEWINLLNAGDVFCDEEILSKVAKNIRENNADIFVGQVVNCEGYLGRIFSIDELKNLEKRMIFCHQSMFMKRELFENKLFDLKYKYSADYEWTLFMYKEGCAFHYMNFPIVFYDSSGVSNANREKTIAEAMCIQKRYACRQDAEDESERVNLKGRLYKHIAYDRVLAYLYYKIMVLRKNNIYWLGDSE